VGSVILKSWSTKLDTILVNQNILEKNFIIWTLFGIWLPVDFVFIFNTKDYKMPKGITFDYDEASIKNKTADKNNDKQGQIEIIYTSYIINKGVSDEVFK